MQRNVRLDAQVCRKFVQFQPYRPPQRGRWFSATQQQIDEGRYEVAGLLPGSDIHHRAGRGDRHSVPEHHAVEAENGRRAADHCVIAAVDRRRSELEFIIAGVRVLETRVGENIRGGADRRPPRLLGGAAIEAISDAGDLPAGIEKQVVVSGIALDPLELDGTIACSKIKREIL